jgi:hypothetical protein
MSLTQAIPTIGVWTVAVVYAYAAASWNSEFGNRSGHVCVYAFGSVFLYAMGVVDLVARFPN